MNTRGTVRLATRGSALAVRQATMVKEALEGRRREVELVEVETRGDEIRDELIHRLGKTGAFVRSLDEKVLAGEVDAAVHSMKDVPTETPDELVLAGIPERGPPGDMLLTPDGRRLGELPEGATVGTASLRRRAQLLARRPDLTVEPLRGNVDTRVEKLLAPSLQREYQRRLEAAGELGDGGAHDEDGDDGDGPTFERDPETWFNELAEIERRALEREVDREFDALVLAEAGMERSGLTATVPHQRLPADEFVPAVGQGTLAVTARDDAIGETVHEIVDHPRTRVETVVERTVLAELGGGCVAPIGVHALIQGEVVNINVGVYDQAGQEAVTATRDLPVERHVEAAREFAADLDERGAGRLIEEAGRET